MRLEIQSFEVLDIKFAGFTGYADGILSVNKQGLIDLISEDLRIKEVDLAITHPGDRVRVTNVLDVYDPRIKEGGAHSYYPGLVSELYRAGQGKTNVLRGCAVIEIGSIPGFVGGLIDMTGKGAQLTPFSRTHNLCLLTKPAPNIEAVEYGMALKQAGLKISMYLARTTLGLIPDSTDTFDLNVPCSPRSGNLPKVGYLFQLHSHGDLREPFVYGDNARHYYPTILHPNEILDGALICGHYNISPALKNTTYSILNHPVILELYRRHGKELDFRGVVIAPEPTTLDEIKRTSMISAGLFKNVLAVDGVIITKEGGGHTDVDLMRNCDECEKVGIKTVLIDNEWLGPDGTEKLSLLDMSVNADAMISVGNVDEVIELSPMDNIIGGKSISDIPGDLKGQAKIPIRSIPEAISQIGLTFLTTESR